MSPIPFKASTVLPGFLFHSSPSRPIKPLPRRSKSNAGFQCSRGDVLLLHELVVSPSPSSSRSPMQTTCWCCCAVLRAICKYTWVLSPNPVLSPRCCTLSAPCYRGASLLL